MNISQVTEPDNRRDPSSSDLRLDDPLVFVVGCPRSGTTLLQRMLNAHPLLAVANDTHFIPRALDRFPLGPDGRLRDEHVRFVRSYRRTRRLNLSEESFTPQPGCSTYRDYIAGIYRRFADANGKQYAGEKTPDYVKHIGLLNELFPDSRFVHIIRDGREVVQSVLDWSNENRGPARMSIWKEHPFAVASLWWAHQVRSGVRTGRSLPERYLEVRYQDLVASADDQLRSICEFLRLPFSERMSRFHDGKVRVQPGLSAKSAWLPATTGLREAGNLSPDQLTLFDLLCGELLEELGMPRLGTGSNRQLAWEAEQIRRRWEMEQARRTAKRTLR